MSNLTEFLNMGGYGFYVWLSYGATFFIFIAFFVSSGRVLQTVKAQIRRYIRRTEK